MRRLTEFISDLFPRMLFWLTCAISSTLVALVLLAPAFDNGAERPPAWRKPVAVFARDAAMRRTAIAAALGLAVTAVVFFRTPRVPRPPRPTRSSSGPVIGA